MIKVLSIGQLPKEVGGSYTTGVTRVVYELSKQKVSDIQQFLYATNVRSKDAKNICTYPNQYMGYKLMPINVLCNILSHPIKTIKEWIHYIKICHVNPLRFEIYKANFDRAIKTVSPDIIHIHGGGISPLYFLNKNKYRLPILRTSHAVPLMREYGAKYYTACDAAKGTRYFADYDTALNLDNRNKLIELGVNPSKISIISNGINSQQFSFNASYRKIIREQNGVKEKTIVFITSGLLIDRKGQLMFLKILQNSRLDFQYWLLGNGPDWLLIKKYIEENGLEKRVKMFGAVRGEDVSMYLSGADIYSHSSTTEAQSLAEIEAYSSGLRIVVNNKVADTVIGDAKANKEIYYVMDFDSNDLTAFKEWASRPTINRHSRDYADWSKIAEKYATLYRSIVSN